METKIIELETVKGSYIAVLLPDGATDFKVHNESAILDYYYDPSMHGIALPEEHNYTLIGPIKDLTEEQKMEVVDDEEWLLPDLYTPSDAFKSLIDSKGIYLVNPHGEEEPNDIPDLGAYTMFSRKKWKMWKEAQENTGLWILIKKD